MPSPSSRREHAPTALSVTELLTIAYAGPMKLGEISTLENGVVR
ncbi:hypothetical protein ACIBG0_01550 [Nocardia sp. NPDC050630]